MKSEQLLSEAFVKAHTVDAAKIIEKLPVEETAQFLTFISSDLAAKLTRFIAPMTASKYLESIEGSKATSIIRNLPLNITAIILRRMEGTKKTALIDSLPDETKESLNLLLQYPENSAGALMDPQVFTLFEDISVKEALRLIRRQPRFVLHHIPVLNRQHVLVGVIKYVRELMLSGAETPISSVMHTGVGYLSPTSNREAISAHPGWSLFNELPVVDEAGVFLGVINFKTIRQLEIEAQESTWTGSAYDTGQALGELYWIGMSAFFKGVTAVVKTEKDRD